MFVWLSFSGVHLKIGNYISWWIRDVVNPIRMWKKEVTVLKERKSRPCLVLWSSRAESDSCVSLDVSWGEVSIRLSPFVVHIHEPLTPSWKERCSSSQERPPIKMNQKCKRECANVEAYCLGLAKIKDSLSSSDRVIRETHPRIAHSNS